MVPKYRFWHIAEKKMYEVLSIHLMTGMVEVEGGKYFLVLQDGFLMQSTGLFDKNGVEIFEGDVVQSQASPHQEDWKNWKVSWNDGAFQADYKDIPADKRRRPTNEVEEVCQDNVNLYGWAVLGNIHEHPHLVEGT